jgi:hypothetical protein
MSLDQLEAMIRYHLGNAETFDRAREPLMAAEFRKIAEQYQIELMRRFE